VLALLADPDRREAISQEVARAGVRNGVDVAVRVLARLLGRE